MHIFIKIISLLTNFLKYNLNIILMMRKTSLLEKNKNLKGEYSGRVFILLTGNSVKDIDLSFLKNEHTIGVNRFFLHPQYEDLDVDFFSCIADWGHSKLWAMSWIVEMCFLKSKKDLITFLHSSASIYINNDKQDYEYRNKKDLFNKNNIHYVTPNGKFSSVDNIQYNIDKPCNIMNGSLYFTIGLAMYLGFDEVYLLGADNAKHPMRAGHFYDGMDEVWNKEEINKGMEKDLHEEMLNKQKEINEFAIKNNIKIFNVIKKGFTSPVFQAVRDENFLNY
jgi:hypothetical protein